MLDAVIRDAHNDEVRATSEIRRNLPTVRVALRMWRLLETKEAQVVIWLAVLAALVAVGVYVVRKVREIAAGNQPQSSEMMSNFRDLHSQGDLSDEEFRTIKNKLAGRMQDELRRSEDEG